MVALAVRVAVRDGVLDVVSVGVTDGVRLDDALAEMDLDDVKEVDGVGVPVALSLTPLV